MTSFIWSEQEVDTIEPEPEPTVVAAPACAIVIFRDAASYPNPRYTDVVYTTAKLSKTVHSNRARYKYWHAYRPSDKKIFYQHSRVRRGIASKEATPEYIEMIKQFIPKPITDKHPTLDAPRAELIREEPLISYTEDGLVRSTAPDAEHSETESLPSLASDSALEQ